jgi:hypothetical protein
VVTPDVIDVAVLWVISLLESAVLVPLARVPLDALTLSPAAFWELFVTDRYTVIVSPGATVVLDVENATVVDDDAELP